MKPDLENAAVELSPGYERALVDRRRFLEAVGFSIATAAIGGCSRAPVEVAEALTAQPPGYRPGRPRYYASPCAGCSAGCGVLVGTRDGRPLKMEGNPEHPLSRGGLGAVGQAIPLELYDSHRLKGPQIDGREVSWQEVDAAVADQLERIRSAGGAVRLVTGSVTSPTLERIIGEFLKPFRDGKHVTFDAVSSSAILDAHEATHGVRVLPHFRLDKADVIVSLGADFLGTWISPVEFAAAWRTGRVPSVEMVPEKDNRPENRGGRNTPMSYHVQLEGRMSLTGSNADRRLRLRDEDQGVVLSHLAMLLSELADKPLAEEELGDSPIAQEELADIANRLWNARGRSLVLCDSQDIATQVLVNYLNHLLDNYGTTVDVDRPSRQRQGNDRETNELVEELRAGKVSALIVFGTDLTHSLPGRESLAEAIGKVPLVVSLAPRIDDFATLAHYLCPDHHALESWLDAEPIRGVVGICQPTLRPLFNTRSVLETLARWSGSTQDARSLVEATWKEEIFERQHQVSTFQEFWDNTLLAGFAQVDPRPLSLDAFKADAVPLVGEPAAGEGYSVVLHSKVSMPDSRHSHNPWLQELPDPLTKVSWDNHVSLSPAAAKAEGLSDGDVVNIQAAGVAIELPVHVQPGQHDRVLAIPLHYGCVGTDRFAEIGPQWLEGRQAVGENGLVGTNAAPLLSLDDGGLHYVRSEAAITATGKHHVLATTQEYNSLDVPKHLAPHGALRREVVQETTLGEFAKDPHAGAPPRAAHHDLEQQLWPEDHPKHGHHWAMVVDQNACTGCSACLIACQSENNVPVVGRDEVRRRREMYWIRVDRYYTGEDDGIQVSFQPMMCQHCDNAPCETVCPVLATVHSEEGLNQQVYNRCVGTRYCANNCPYKARRFNWFNYTHDDELQNLSLNPDVTVRSRGVMEKCSMCVQRIQDAKIEAKRCGEELADGTIQTACQQTCPGGAIVFGDLNDPESKVGKAMKNPRRYRVLEELNVRPSVAYLRKVRNQG